MEGRRRVIVILELLLVFAGVLVAGGWAAARAAALDLPARIDTRLTLLEQFGYAPGHQLNAPSFDPLNRPVIRSRAASQHVTLTAVRMGDDGKWISVSLLTAVRRAYPGFTNTINGGGYVSERIEFDERGRASTLLEIRVRGGWYYNVLL